MSLARQLTRRVGITSSPSSVFRSVCSTVLSRAQSTTSTPWTPSSTTPASPTQTPRPAAPVPGLPPRPATAPAIPASLPFQRLRLDALNSSEVEPSWEGLSASRVSSEAEEALRRPLSVADVEVKPDGIIYLPEIKYRKVLCDAFGPGGWGLVPRGDVLIGEKVISREFALWVDGRIMAQTIGENPYFGPEQLPTAIEGCKSNALMRCCKDLGVAAELWDPNFIRSFRKAHMVKLWVTHMVTKKKKVIWMKKGTEDEIPYPYEK